MTVDGVFGRGAGLRLLLFLLLRRGLDMRLLVKLFALFFFLSVVGEYVYLAYKVGIDRLD